MSKLTRQMRDAFETFSNAEWAEVLQIAERLGKSLQQTAATVVPNAIDAALAASPWKRPRKVNVPERTLGHPLPERMITYWLMRDGMSIGGTRQPDNTGAEAVRAEALRMHRAVPLTGPRGEDVWTVENAIKFATVVVIADPGNRHSVFLKDPAAYEAEVTRQDGPRILARLHTFAEHPDDDVVDVEFEATIPVLDALNDGHVPRDRSCGEMATNFLWDYAPEAERREIGDKPFEILVEHSMRAYLKATDQLHLLEPQREAERPRG